MNPELRPSIGQATVQTAVEKEILDTMLSEITNAREAGPVLARRGPTSVEHVRQKITKRGPVC